MLRRHDVRKRTSVREEEGEEERRFFLERRVTMCVMNMGGREKGKCN